MGQGQLVSPSQAALFIPAGLKKFKLDLFERIGRHIEAAGGRTVRHNEKLLLDLPDEIIPITGSGPELRPINLEWKARGRTFIHWDRGYARRVFATWLPRGENGGFYRWHRDCYQLREIRPYPDDRWKALKTDVLPWRKNGRHIVVAAPTPNYAAFNGCENWLEKTTLKLKRLTDRPLVFREKTSTRSLQDDLKGAHALVAHGSNAAVEAVILGCPVFVDASSAAALVGKTDLSDIEKPSYPDRQPWLNALSYSQFCERELCDGTLWRLLT